MKSLLHNKALILLLVLLLPLFFINVKNTHDWGDDFAQYLIQARNMLEHKPQTENGLVVNEHTGQYMVKAYPVGFPLLVAGTWKVFGYSIRNFELLITMCMIGFALCMFFLLKRFVSEWVAVVFTLAIFYNPVLLNFKKQVLSDIPFALFFISSILSATAQKKRPLLTGILIGFATSIRGVGICLLIIPLSFLVRRERRSAIIVLVSSAAIFLLLNNILFSTASTNFFQYYKNAFSFSGIVNQISVNATYYYEVLKYFFSQGEGIWQKISNITKYFFVFSFIIGLLYSIITRRNQLLNAVTLVYIGVLLFYPYQAGGFRFLIPIIPLIILFSIIGFQNILKVRRYWLIPVGLLLLIQNYDGFRWIVRTQHEIEDGPQKPAAMAAFGYIQNKLKPTDVVAFIKPRALTFYTSVRTATVAYDVNAEQAVAAFDKMSFFLIASNNDALRDDKLEHYINIRNVQIVWQNEDFKLYSRTQSSP